MMLCKTETKCWGQERRRKRDNNMKIQLPPTEVSRRCRMRLLLILPPPPAIVPSYTAPIDNVRGGCGAIVTTVTTIKRATIEYRATRPCNQQVHLLTGC